MKGSRLIVFAIALALGSGVETARGDVLGTAFTYQGQLMDQGVPANEEYDFIFKLFDDPVGGAQVGDDVEIEEWFVSDGLFTVELDFGTDVFTGDALWLEVSVRLSDGGGEYTELSPRQPLKATPYALYALNGPGSGGFWAGSGNDVYNTNSGNIGVGTSSPLEKLHVAGPVAALRLQDDDDAGSYTSIYDQTSGMMRVDKLAGSGVALMDLNPRPLDGVSDATVRFFRRTNTSGPKAVIFNRGDNTTGASAMIGAGGLDSWFQADGGNFGIGTTGPVAPLEVHNNTTGEILRLVSDRTYGYVHFREGSATRAYMGFGDAGDLLVNATPDSFAIDGLSTALHLAVDSDATKGITVNTNGNVGIGTTGPSAQLTIGNGAHKIRLERDGLESWSVYQTTTGSDGLGFHNDDDAAYRMFLSQDGNVGIGTTTPETKLDVAGNVIVRSASTSAILIELGEGLDYAEGFDVSDKSQIAPGMVLVIDADNPGRLDIAGAPYDRKVAGIVAGANGLGSAVRLGAGQFDLDVALAGRVYCNVDATYGAIQPGDLLTTSPTPGYAMKVTDHAKAQGAILGKAMQPLKQGEKGQILVLVTLQ